MALFDAHTHPQFPAYDHDRTDVMERSRAARVKMIAVGTAMSTSQAAIQLAESYPDCVWAAVGVHPSHCTIERYHDVNELRVPENETLNAEQLRELATHPKVVAIGECGLDAYRFKQRANGIEQIERQKKGFIAQMEIAHAVKKPLMIHCREAFGDLINILTENRSMLLPGRPGVIHFMSGSKDDAKQLADLGFSFTFGGVLTFTRDYDELVQMIPVDRLFSETDAPYVAPVPYRGRRNEPAYVTEVVRRLAELKGLSEEAMEIQIQENALRVFGIP